MTTISMLKIKNVESRRQTQNYGKSSAQLISLLAFLQAENRKLQHAVAQLRRDTKALQEALQMTESARFMQSRNQGGMN